MKADATPMLASFGGDVGAQAQRPSSAVLAALDARAAKDTAGHIEDNKRTVLFVDLDDVLVLNNPFGGYDAKLALASGPSNQGERQEIWTQLFDINACELLMRLHREFRPIYVLTTSWWWLFAEEELAEVFERCGLSCVWNNLHCDWSTPRGRRPKDRWVEIRHWLDVHPEAADTWVVLDDTLSGTGLGTDLPDELRPFVVLCSPNVGLTTIEYKQLRAAFNRRIAQSKGPAAPPTYSGTESEG